MMGGMIAPGIRCVKANLGHVQPNIKAGYVAVAAFGNGDGELAAALLVDAVLAVEDWALPGAVRTLRWMWAVRPLLFLKHAQKANSKKG